MEFMKSVFSYLVALLLASLSLSLSLSLFENVYFLGLDNLEEIDTRDKRSTPGWEFKDGAFSNK